MNDRSNLRTLGLVVALTLSILPTRTSFAGDAHELAPGRYEIRSSDSYVGYEITKLGFVNVRGQFGRVQGEIVIDPKDFADSRTSVRVAVASLQSGKEGRTKTLLSSDFFHARRYPEMRFESRSVRRTPDGDLVVTGRLTIRGNTKEVTVTVNVTRAEGIEGPVVVFSTTFEIDRRDFGVLGRRWSAGRALLSNEVQIELTLTAQPA